MTDEDALLAAIRAAPDDDVPRLVYADWIEEHGQAARAEFIRLQCALAADDLTGKDRARADERAAALLDRHDAEWFPTPPGFATSGDHVRRGFREVFEGSAAEFVGHAEELFAIAPLLTEYFVTDSPEDEDFDPPDWAAFFRCKHLRRITALGFADFAVDADAAFEMYRSKHLRQLRQLDLAFSALGPEGALELCSGSYPNLETLNLLDGNVGDAGADAVGWPKTFPKLVELCMAGCDITGEGLRDLANGHLERLKELKLFENPLGNDGAKVVAESDWFGQLEVLNLARCRIRATGGLALAKSPHLGGLKSLDLTGNVLGERAKAQLTERFGDRVRL